MTTNDPKSSVINIEQMLQSAKVHHQAGRLLEARTIYQNILARQPDHADALHLLGLVTAQTGRHQEAAELIQRAIGFNPAKAQYQNNLGMILLTLGRTDAAIEAYRRAIKLQPDYAQAHDNLGDVLMMQGRPAEAVQAYQHAFGPERNEFAVLNKLGSALQGMGELAAAIESYQLAIRLKPEYAEAHNNLGNALQMQGRLSESLAAYQQALRFRPDDPEIQNNFGVSLMGLGRLDEAEQVFLAALGKNPRQARTHNNLGNIFKHQGRHDEATSAYRQALALAPDYAEAHSNLLLEMLYCGAHDAKTIREESRLWNQRHAEPLKIFTEPHHHDRDPERRLKIGYVSGDLRKHVVGWNLLPLLREHDRQHFEIICYSNAIRADEMTERIRRACDGWRNIAGIGDAQAARMVRADNIDILVDLALHTGNNRLLLFARKPAPVQVTYLGYPGTTGLDTIDYRFSDPFLDPPEADLSVYSEQTVRLPETYWCYEPGGPTPACTPPPVLAAGYVTFGCLNNFAKVSPAALELWAQILLAMDRAKMIIHCHPGRHRDRIRERFKQNKISPERIELAGEQSWQDYIGTFNRIDISLDPLGYNGGISTCDSLNMGVPVVSLAGQTAVGRAGKSILNNISLPELVANKPEEYVQIAVKLASDLPRLKELRTTLRGRMENSPLMDAKRFARNVEAAYRQMWRRRCRSAQIM